MRARSDYGECSARHKRTAESGPFSGERLHRADILTNCSAAFSYQPHDALFSEEVSMKSPVLSALSLAFAVGILSGCSGSGSDNTPIMSSGLSAAAAEDDQRVPQSDALTAAEA